MQYEAYEASSNYRISDDIRAEHPESLALIVRGLTVAGREVETSREYLIAINSLFNEIAADGIDMFHKAPRARLHGELIRDVVMNYLRTKRHVSGELPRRVCCVTE